MEQNENTEAGYTDATKDRIHNFHRVHTVTFLKDLIEDSPKLSLRFSRALRVQRVDEARCKTGHQTLDILLHTRITIVLPYLDITSGHYYSMLEFYYTPG